MKLKKTAAPIETDDFYYDLFDGGYIDPAEILVDPEEVVNAMRVIRDFYNFLEENEMIDEM